MSTATARLAIKLKLDEKGMSQRDLAKQLEITEAWLSNLLSGKSEMKLDVFIKIAKILEASPSELLRGYSAEPAIAA